MLNLGNDSALLQVRRWPTAKTGTLARDRALMANSKMASNGLHLLAPTAYVVPSYTTTPALVQCKRLFATFEIRLYNQVSLSLSLSHTSLALLAEGSHVMRSPTKSDTCEEIKASCRQPHM